jgi:Flp pilus assembly protein TadG
MRRRTEKKHHMTEGVWGRSGQNLVEFAMIVVLLLAIVLGIADFGRLWMTNQAVTNAAREGARLAALPNGFSDPAAVTASVTSYLTSANLDPASATVTLAGVSDGTGLPATVTVSYVVNGGLFLGPVLALLPGGSGMPGTFTLTQTATMRNE